MTQEHNDSNTDHQSQNLLSLDNPIWNLAAASSQKPVKQWAISALDAAASQASTTCYDQTVLDDIQFEHLASDYNPYPFQVTAIRHWVGLTQTKAADLISTRLSTYRNCESIEECVLMDADRWSDYVKKATALLRDAEYSTLPNCFGRAMRGLSGLTYRELNDISNLSQSYWTTRLRFKHPPAPIELESVNELIKVVVSTIDQKFDKGLFCEGKAMLKSLLYLAFETQKARVALNPSLVSPMHVISTPVETDIMPPSDPTKNHKKKKLNLIDTANLYARTIEELAMSGYRFTNNHSNINFQTIE